MKKILAILLTAAMLATMLCVSVSAAKEVGGDDGVLTFDPTSAGQDLNVKVTDITHKYAVDVTFGLDDLVIGGTITWNVNTMKYDVDGTTLDDATRTITVSNRSDLPVYAYATVVDAVDDDGITVTADTYSAENKLTIDKATAGSGTADGTAKEADLTISITSADWNTAAEYYAAKKLADETQSIFKIAGVTVTISKD